MNPGEALAHGYVPARELAAANKRITKLENCLGRMVKTLPKGWATEVEELLACRRSRR